MSKTQPVDFGGLVTDENTTSTQSFKDALAQKKKPKKKKPVEPIIFSAFDGKLFSQDIIAKREKDDTTHREAAKAMKISPSAVHDMEAYNTCNINRLHIVCNWLNLPVSRYFSPAKKKKHAGSKKG